MYNTVLTNERGLALNSETSHIEIALSGTLNVKLIVFSKYQLVEEIKALLQYS